MNCPICKKEFNEKTGRRPKKFCSDVCKVKFWNGVKKHKIEVKVINLTEPLKPKDYIKKPLKNESVNTTQKVYTIEMCEKELMTLGEGTFARQRREFLRKKVLELLNQK